MHRGLSEKYCLTTLASRLVKLMCEIWPVCFCINDLVDRHALHSVFGSLLGTVQSGRNSTTALLADVSKNHPSWANNIDSFVKAAEGDNVIITKYAATEVDPAHLAKFRDARVCSQCKPLAP